MEKAEYSGQGSSEYPFSTDKIAQGSLPHMRYLIREQNIIIPEDLLLMFRSVSFIASLSTVSDSIYTLSSSTLSSAYFTELA